MILNYANLRSVPDVFVLNPFGSVHGPIGLFFFPHPRSFESVKTVASVPVENVIVRDTLHHPLPPLYSLLPHLHPLQSLICHLRQLFLSRFTLGETHRSSVI